MCMRPIGCIIRNATAFWMKISEISLPNSGSIWSIWLSAAFTIRSLMRSSIYLLRNENVPDAQLPAYCFMPDEERHVLRSQCSEDDRERARRSRRSPAAHGFMSPTAVALAGGEVGEQERDDRT